MGCKTLLSSVQFNRKAVSYTRFIYACNLCERVVGCWCLERGADLHMAQLMPLPLTVSCFSKIHIGFTFLVPAHPGSPGKMAVKRVCVTRANNIGCYLYFRKCKCPVPLVFSVIFCSSVPCVILSWLSLSFRVHVNIAHCVG